MTNLPRLNKNPPMPQQHPCKAPSAAASNTPSKIPTKTLAQTLSKTKPPHKTSPPNKANTPDKTNSFKNKPQINSGFFLPTHYKRCKATSGNNAVNRLVGILSIVCLLLGCVSATANTAQQQHDSGSNGNAPSNPEALNKATSATLAHEFFISIPPLNAAEALNRLAKQTGAQLLYSYEQALTRKAHPVVGQYSVMDALTQLLKGSGLEGSLSNKGAITISDSEKVAHHNQRERMNMNSKTIAKKTLLAAAVGLFAAGGAAVAQDQINEGTKAQGVLDEIIVTATKRKQNIQDVPISIFALKGEKLAAQGITDLQSLSFAVPGLLVDDSGSQNRRISIRGVGNVFGGSSLVGLYVDEVSVASLPDGQIDLRIHDLERVEVLKGPQGTLYGEGSVGGTIRYITNSPQLDGFSGVLSAEASATQDGDPSQEIKSILNIPLTDDILGLRIVGQYINSGGWIDQPALSKSNINDSELVNVRTKLLWLPSDDLEIEATAINHRNNVGAQNVGEDEDGNYHQSFGDLSTPSGQDDYNIYSVSINYDLDGMSFVSSTSYMDADKETNDSSSQCCFPAVTGSPGSLNNIILSSTASVETLTQEFRLSSNNDSLWNWTAGIFYKDTQQILTTEQLLFGEPEGTIGVDIFNFGDSYADKESTSWAVFGEGSYTLTDQWEMGVGLRYFEDDRKSRSGKVGPFEEESFDSLNPKVYLKYALSEDVNLYANAAKGFRSGGFNSTAGTPAFDPESVWSYELGSKMQFLEGRLNAEIALFYSDYEDYQVNGVPPEGGFSLTSNGGAAEILGVDWSLSWLASEHLELGFSGNYMDTEFVEINVTSSSYAEGDPLDLVPQYGVNLWANYSFTWFENSPGFFRVDYSQQGKSNYRNRAFDNPSIGLVYHSQSDVIDMLNARLGWEQGGWSVEAYGLNLLDEDGFIGPISIELLASRPHPRTVGLKFGFTF